MTRILTTGVLVMLTLASYAQTTPVKPIVPVDTEGSGTTAGPRNIDLAIAAVGRLNNEMNLSDQQKQKVTEVIGRYFDEKARIIPLMDANRPAYNEKQASYFKTLRVKLKDILVRNQLQKFMQLKPRPEETDNSLYYIYY